MSTLFKDAEQVEREVVARFRRARLDPTCGAGGVDADGMCVRCGYRVDAENDHVTCPPGFLGSILHERAAVRKRRRSSTDQRATTGARGTE